MLRIEYDSVHQSVRKMFINCSNHLSNDELLILCLKTAIIFNYVLYYCSYNALSNISS